MKKEATPEHKRLKRKTSDEKSGNPRTQGAQKKDLWWKKRQPQNARGLKERPPMNKESTLERKGLERKTSEEKEVISKNQKSGTVSSPKPALLN
jgi:hypothetical protein